MTGTLFILNFTLPPESVILLTLQRIVKPLTRTRWRRVKTLGRHKVGVNFQRHPQHQL